MKSLRTSSTPEFRPAGRVLAGLLLLTLLSAVLSLCLGSTTLSPALVPQALLGQLEGADLGKIDALTELARAVAAKSEKELGHGIIEFREAQKAAETAPKKRAVRKKPAPTDAAKPESGK